jgi:hypothetical protein
VRELKLKEIDEVTDYDIDGVVISLAGHMDGAAGDAPCDYGYNPTVVAQYRQRYGIDPLNQEVDPHKFYALHGEGFTEFVRGVSKLVRAKGKKLVCGTRIDGVHGWGGAAAGKALIGETMPPDDTRDGKSALPIAAGFYLETENWAAEKLIDGLLCAAPYEEGIQKVQELRDRVGVPTYLWRKYTSWEGKVTGRTLEEFQAEARAVRNGALDGYCIFIMQISKHPLAQPYWGLVFKR